MTSFTFSTCRTLPTQNSAASMAWPARSENAIRRHRHRRQRRQSLRQLPALPLPLQPRPARRLIRPSSCCRSRRSTPAPRIARENHQRRRRCRHRAQAGRARPKPPSTALCAAAASHPLCPPCRLHLLRTCCSRISCTRGRHRLLSAAQRRGRRRHFQPAIA